MSTNFQPSQRLSSLLQSYNDASAVYTEKEQILMSEMSLQQVAPVLGYGQELERMLGILRTAAGHLRRDELAARLSIDAGILAIFRNAYGNTSFVNNKGALIAEAPMDIELVKDIVLYTANAWNIQLSPECFDKLTAEAVERNYARAREEAQLTWEALQTVQEAPMLDPMA